VINVFYPQISQIYADCGNGIFAEEIVAVVASTNLR